MNYFAKEMTSARVLTNQKRLSFLPNYVSIVEHSSLYLRPVKTLA